MTARTIRSTERRGHRRRVHGRAVGAGFGLLTLLAAAGCSGNGGAASSPGAAVGSVDGGGLAATGAALPVPLTTTTSGSHDIVTVSITVGGGDPFTVMLDTGSSGLLVDSSVVGSQVSATGGPFTQNYASGPVSGSLGTAVVGIGGVSTAQPITVGLIDPSSAGSAFPTGTHGILGVATGGGNTPQLLAPNLQLPAPYAAGSTLQVGATDGAAGTWTLGPVSAPAGATAVPLVASDAGSSTPAGYPAFAKDVTLCWTIGSQANTCGATDLDTGNDTPALNATTYSSLGALHTVLPSGQPITMAPPDGAPLWSFTTGSTTGVDAVKLSSLGSDTQFNTGLPFFLGRTVAWNYASGQLLIGPAA